VGATHGKNKKTPWQPWRG